MSEDKGFKVIDRRGKEEPREVCRVCGSPVCHSKQYNQPGMDCIAYLRGEIARLSQENLVLKQDVMTAKGILK